VNIPRDFRLFLECFESTEAVALFLFPMLPIQVWSLSPLGWQIFLRGPTLCQHYLVDATFLTFAIGRPLRANSLQRAILHFLSHPFRSFFFLVTN